MERLAAQEVVISVNGQAPGQEDVGEWKREVKLRASRKRKRHKSLRRDALKDLRKYKSRMKTFRAFVLLARSPTTPGITVATLCHDAGISEATFHKNFTAGVPKDELSGVHGLMLVAVEEVTRLWMREFRREIERREAQGEEADRTDRAMLAASYLVKFMTHYPRIFQVEGIIPREVILVLSDALVEAIIWDDAVTQQGRADLTAVMKYHAAALVGVMRSGLGSEADPDTYTQRITRVMISQMVPALRMTDQEMRDETAASSDVDHPVVFDVPSCIQHQLHFDDGAWDLVSTLVDKHRSACQ